jgi:hypothetical protein
MFKKNPHKSGMAVVLFYLSIKLRITETFITADNANGRALSICFLALL